MTAKPAPAVIRSPGWIAALVAILAVLGFNYTQLFTDCWPKWLSPDYSHAFLVPLFSLYLAWMWRDQAPKQIAWPNPWGFAFLAGGILVYLAAAITNFAREWLWGVSLVLNLCGTALLLGGPQALRWLWPSLAFLMFMFPLPYKIEHAVGWPLQNVAARGAAFALQTLGYATYREGVVLHVQAHALEVEKACNGLSMLLTFIAVSTAVAILVKRPWLDRGIILASAIPIAIFSNVLRIALTGLLYNEGGKELGDKVFHDFAGWLMMPLALGILWIELKLLDWVFLEDLGQASREDVLKLTAKPAHLFMPTFLAAQGQEPRPGQKPASPNVPGGQK